MIKFKTYPAGLELCDAYGNEFRATEGQKHSNSRYDDKPTGGMQNVFAVTAKAIPLTVREFGDANNQDVTNSIVAAFGLLKARGLSYTDVLVLCESCVSDPESEMGLMEYIDHEKV